MSHPAAQTARMRSRPVRSAPDRDPQQPEHAELSPITIALVLACAALVACPTLVALTHGWDYRLAVMLGAGPAVVLARWGWRRLPAERLADRVSVAFAGTLAALLLLAYGSDWLDWRPRGFDDAVAGMAIGFVFLVMGPARLALLHPGLPGVLSFFIAFVVGALLALAATPIWAFVVLAAMATGWWLHRRRGVRPSSPQRFERVGRRQRLLQHALAASFALTLGVHVLLLQAAVHDRTGPEVLAKLREYRLYRVSDATFARAMLKDHYLWRASVSVPASVAMHVHPAELVDASRHQRDRWSWTGEVQLARLLRERNPKGYGVVLETVASGKLVWYVYEGSPAHRAGVRRGDVIRAIDGVALDGPDAPGLPAADSARQAVHLELVSPAGEVREVSVTPAEYVRSAVGAEGVIDVAGRRVGYLALHDFLEQSDDEFIAAAARLHEEEIDELVLDLRLNGGGLIYASLRIASAIGGERLDGEVFMRLAHNGRYRDRDRKLRFFAPARGALSLSRVLVITSEETCSASEALINGLAPRLEVVTIGTTTCGKPFGSTLVEYGEHAYAIATFRVTNAHGQADYDTGLPPTCAAEDDPTRELGDPEEASLKAALHYVRHGRCPDTPAARALP